MTWATLRASWGWMHRPIGAARIGLALKGKRCWLCCAQPIKELSCAENRLILCVRGWVVQWCLQCTTEQPFCLNDAEWDSVLDSTTMKFPEARRAKSTVTRICCTRPSGTHECALAAVRGRTGNTGVLPYCRPVPQDPSVPLCRQLVAGWERPPGLPQSSISPQTIHMLWNTAVIVQTNTDQHCWQHRPTTFSSSAAGKRNFTLTFCPDAGCLQLKLYNVHKCNIRNELGANFNESEMVHAQYTNDNNLKKEIAKSYIRFVRMHRWDAIVWNNRESHSIW